VSSALARTEVGRALLPLGSRAMARGGEVQAQVNLVRVSDAPPGVRARLDEDRLE